MKHPEYVGREYKDYGTKHCEVSIDVGSSKDYPDKKPWSMTTTWFRFANTN